MSLRIRRGTNSERLTKTFDQGELAWTTDTEKLYVGDGVTAGGKNILQSSAGVGFVFNSTTQALEFTVPALNLTTSLVPDSVTTNHLTTGSSGTTFKVVSTAGIQPGMLIVASSFLSSQTVTVVVDSQTLTISSAPDVAVVNNTAITFRSPNLYFTNSRAGQAVYDAFGRGSNSGITFAYNAGTNAISATITTGNLLPSQTGNSGKYLTTDGIGGLTWTNPISGNMLLPSEAGNQGKYLKVDNSSLPAWADIVIDRLTVNAYSTVLDSFGNLTTPGDIKIPAGKDIKRDNGTGTYVSITGGLGAVSQDTSPSLGGNLSLATRSITGSGSIGITGNIVNTGNAEFTGSIKAQSLGGNLSLGTYNITGTGNIEIGGNITNYGNYILSGNLTGAGNITRTGNVTITGTISVLGTGTISASGGITAIGDVSSNGIVKSPRVVTDVIQTPDTNLSSLELLTLKDNGIDIVGYRGSRLTPTTMLAGDNAGQLSFKSFNGTNNNSVSLAIVGSLDASATVADQNPKSLFRLFVGAGGTNVVTASFAYTGVFNAPVLGTTVYSAAGTGLPSAATTGAGARAFVTDATSNTFNTGYTSGGANKVPVFSDGTVWRIG